MSIALNHIGLVHVNTGRQEEALDHLRRALDTAERAGDKHGALHAAGNLAWAYLRGADHVQAIATYRQALSLARDIGAGTCRQRHRRQHGGDLSGTGRVRPGQDLCGVFASDGTSTSETGRRSPTRSPTWARSTRPRAAGPGRTAAGACGALARELNAPHFLGDWLHRLARVHMATGRLQTAEKLNAEALTIAEVHQERDTLVSAHLLSVRLQVASGRITAGAAAQTLREKAGEWTEPHEVAALLDTVRRLDQRDDAARNGCRRDLSDALRARADRRVPPCLPAAHR